MRHLDQNVVVTELATFPDKKNYILLSFCLNLIRLTITFKLTDNSRMLKLCM